MKDFDKNISNLHDCLGNNDHGWLEKRMVYVVEAAAERPQSAAENTTPTPNLDVNNPDFDNQNFETEIKGNFTDTLDNAISAVLKKIEGLQETSFEFLKLKNDFTAGLTEKIIANKAAITAEVKRGLPNSPGATTLESAQQAGALQAFATVLKELNCTQIGLVHDKEKDVTQFKFYNGTTEISFPQTDIAIKYQPQAVSATPEALPPRDRKDNVLLKNPLPKVKFNRVDNIAVWKLQYPETDPQLNDYIIVKRGISELKATCREKNGQKDFYTEDGVRLWLIAGDKLTMIPRNEAPKTNPSEGKHLLTVDGTPYPVLARVTLGENKPADIAKEIYTGTPTYLDAGICESIKSSGMTEAEYAELLQKAHTEAGTGPRLPILLPPEQAKKQAEQDMQTQRSAQAAREAALARVRPAHLNTLTTWAQNLLRHPGIINPRDLQKLTQTVQAYDAQLARLNPQNTEWKNVWEEFWDKMESYFKNAGLERNIIAETRTAIEQGKNGQTWMEMWTKENPSVKRLMTIINNYPDVFGNLSKNQVRDRVYETINAGSTAHFDSGDLIKHFGITFEPAGLNYENVLAMAAYTGQPSSPQLKILHERCRHYATAIESLGDSISRLNSNQTNQSARQISRQEGRLQHEKLRENSDKKAQDLKKLIDQLLVTASGPIVNENDGKSYSCTIEKDGKQVLLRLTPRGVGQYLTVHESETGQELAKFWDRGRLDVEKYVEEINNILRTRSAMAETAGLARDAVAVARGTTFYSLRELERLNQSVPGIPVRDMLEIVEQKKASHQDAKTIAWVKDTFSFSKKETLIKGIRYGLSSLGLLDSAMLVDSPENKALIKGNDAAYINARYKGRDLTFKFENTATGYNIYLAPGFNQPKRSFIKAHSEWGSLDSLTEMVANIDAKVNTLPSNVERMKNQNPAVERTAIAPKITQSINLALQEYRTKTNYPHHLNLNDSQALELIFRLNSLENLRAEGCFKRVTNQRETTYVLNQRPKNLQQISRDEAKMAWSIKYQKNATNDRQRQQMNTATEAARESNDQQELYKNRLKRIFAYGLTNFDTENRTITTATLDTNQAENIENDYFKRASGTAVYNDFYNTYRTRDGQGREIIDADKAHGALNNYYQLGWQRARRLSATGNYYKQLFDKVKGVPNTTFDITKRMPTQNQTALIRLGYLESLEKTERQQEGDLEKGGEQVKAKLIEQMMELFGKEEDVVDPKTKEKIATRNQIRSSLRTLPVGILINYSRNADKTHTLGLTLPITLAIPGSEKTQIVLAPHVDNSGISFGVGIAYSSRDGNDKDQRFSFFGSVSATVGVNKGKFNIGPAAATGLDYKWHPASETSKWDYYSGIYAAAGLDLANGVGLNAGVNVFEWQVNARQAYENGLREHYKEKQVQGYIDQLSGIYKQGSKPGEITRFCNDLKRARLGDITQNDKETEVLLKFEQYIGLITEDFNRNFSLPTISGGQVKISVVDGTIIAVGAGTGNVPLLVGGLSSWGIQVLASLQLNLASHTVNSLRQKTSDDTMNVYNEMKLQEEKNSQFDDTFSSFDHNAGAARIFGSGHTTNMRDGTLRTEMGTEITVERNETSGQPNNFAKLNESLRQKGIDVQIQPTTDSPPYMEIVFLDSDVASNDKILISSDIATLHQGKLVLRDPNALKYLFIDSQARTYQFETSHGASIERVITISDNRYHTGSTFPAEITITRYADNKKRPILEGNTNKPAIAFETNEAGMSDQYKPAHERMKQALNQSGSTERQEAVREGLKDLAKKIYAWRDNAGNTFLKITNEKSEENLNNPDYLDTKLYEFYTEYEKAHSDLPPLNAHERRLLTLELSTLRYINLNAGKRSAAERAAALRKELTDWAKKTLTPYFQARINELKARGLDIDNDADKLALKATEDLTYLNTDMPRTPLLPGTSVGVTIGRGVNGIHQVADGSITGTEAANEHGFITGKNYTEALRTKQPPEDYQIALILSTQLSHLPEASQENLKGFMESPLSRALASDPGLIYLIGPNNYATITDYYEKGTGLMGHDAFRQFTALVQTIRTAQLDGKEVISVVDQNGKTAMIKIDTQISSGIFSKCGNYSIAVREQLHIIIPGTPAAMAFMANSSNARTSTDVFTSKEGVALNVGATATISPTPGGPTTETEESTPGSGSGNVDQKAGAGTGAEVTVPAVTQPDNGSPAGPAAAPTGNN